MTVIEYRSVCVWLVLMLRALLLGCCWLLLVDSNQWKRGTLITPYNKYALKYHFRQALSFIKVYSYNRRVCDCFIIL